MAAPASESDCEKISTPPRPGERRCLKGSESRPSKCKRKRVRAAEQTFRQSYTEEWPCIVKSHNGDPHYAYCNLCKVQISVKHGGRNDVFNHVETNKHKSNGRIVKQNKAIGSYFV